jgi:hypothetical protein
MFEVRRVSMLLAVGAFCLSLATVGSATNLVANGEFATDASGWTMLHTASSGTDDRVTATYIGTTGYPAGSVKLERFTSALATSGHRYYQFVPVEPNTRYYVRAQWKGDLAVGSTGSGVAEMHVSFTADVNTVQAGWGSSSLRYRKSWDGVNNVNVASSGQWNWEDVTTSPNGTPPAYFTSQGSHHYMAIAFNLTGTAMTPTTAQPYVYIDNVYVVACTNWSNADVNKDCRVNLIDFALFTSQWLTCNLDPASSCW